MDEQALRELGETLQAIFAEHVLAAAVDRGELTVTVAPASLVRVLSFLRDDVNFHFRQLMDVCGVDHPEREKRFDVVYNLLSLTHNRRIRVKVMTDEHEPVPSVTGVFNSANQPFLPQIGVSYMPIVITSNCPPLVAISVVTR